jgi:hypothetical protein
MCLKRYVIFVKVISFLSNAKYHDSGAISTFTFGLTAMTNEPLELSV